jgi:type VI protein secretion system component VasK
MTAFATAEGEAIKALDKAADPELRRAVADALRQALAFARQQLERELFAETVRSVASHVQFDKGEALVTALGAVPAGYPERWQDLVESASLNACGDLDEAVTRIAFLASPQSPLRQLLRGAWLGQGTIGGRAIPAADWLDGCLAALATVQGECALLAAADPALRLGDIATLQKLADTVTKADQAITAALKPVDNPRLYNAARRLFSEVLENARHCASARLGADADRLWKEGFHAFWSSHAHKFPFADTDVDLDPALLGELLGAKSGRLWATAKVIDAASAVTVLGKPLVRTSDDWRAALVRASGLRDLLYAEGGDTLLMPIAATFRQRAGVNDLRLTIGASSAGLYDSPHRRASLAWREDGPQSAQLQANVEDGQTLTVGVEGKPWAFLRLVKGGNPLPLPEGGVLLSWELRPVAGQADRRYLAQVVIEVPRFAEQLAAGLFTGLRFPPQVTPR